jgi:hypothetical protein
MGSTMNWAFSLPAMTSSAARAMASASLASRWPVSRLASAEAFLTMAMARMSAG